VSSSNGHGPSERALAAEIIATRPERRVWEIAPTDDKDEQLAIRAERLRFLNETEGEAA
jgi:hypothetical protein